MKRWRYLSLGMVIAVTSHLGLNATEFKLANTLKFEYGSTKTIVYGKRFTSQPQLLPQNGPNSAILTPGTLPTGSFLFFHEGQIEIGSSMLSVQRDSNGKVLGYEGSVVPLTFEGKSDSVEHLIGQGKLSLKVLESGLLYGVLIGKLSNGLLIEIQFSTPA